MPNTIAANRLLCERIPYPLHLGITEAGTKWSGSLKSAVGLGTLLADGIGDTIRISLSTFHAEEEVKVAWEILKALKLRERGPVLIACPTCGRLQFDMDTVVADIERRLEAYEDPIEVAVLGCAVNGIGEASHADFGITGAKNEGLIFSRGKALQKVPQEQLVDELFAEIDKYATTKQIEVDAAEQAAGAEWLQRIEEENAGELTPERLAKLEAEKAARADADAMDEALAAPRRGRLARPPAAASPAPRRMAPLSAGELLAGYAARTLSPVEVVAELSRRDRGRSARRVLGDSAWSARRTRRARRRPRGRAARRGRSRACPIAVKDIFDTEGVATTYGSGMFRDHVPGRDAEAVRRVRDAGAIVLGKTATHEFAWGFSSINDAPRHGPQPARPRARGGRLQRRLGRGAGGRPGAAGARHGHRRLDPRAERVLRHVRAQADVGAGEPRRRLAARAHARPRRADGAHVRRTSRCCSACSRPVARPGARRRAAARRRLPGPARLLRSSRGSRPPTRRSPPRWTPSRSPFPEAELIVPPSGRSSSPRATRRTGAAGLYPRAGGGVRRRRARPGRDGRGRSTLPRAARRARRPRDGARRLRAPVRAGRRAADARRAARPAADRGRARATRRCARRCSPTRPRRTSSGCPRACCRTGCSSPDRRARRRSCYPSQRRSPRCRVP